MVVNTSPGNILRVLVEDRLKWWDKVLSHAEIAYNQPKNRTTQKSLFEIIYGIES